MTPEELRRIIANNPAPDRSRIRGLVSGISGFFGELSSVDRANRQREQIRQDLVREHLDARRRVEPPDSDGLGQKINRLLKLN